MEIVTYIVDSFTDKPFSGNPAGVCLLEEDLSEELMLSISSELGLSETAYVRNTGEANEFSIRYFSPKMEIPLCGHATLAASKVLFDAHEGMGKIHFTTIQGLELMVERSGELIVMEFPIYATVPQKAPPEMLEALGITKIMNSEYNAETNILLLEIEDSKVLKRLRPDFEKLIHTHDSISGVLVTAISQQLNYDFESRYFWPWSGTNEDPVTGGTHTFLGKYWGDRLKTNTLNSFQCSERTGFMEVELISEDKLKIKSQAQIVLKGNLTLKNLNS